MDEMETNAIVQDGVAAHITASILEKQLWLEIWKFAN